ncbi:hypothetical protein CDD82_2181 [Ophiocordyceps australis]|uniref:Uncharacterized protein n=1 Tax=Ophiocordyceps australis TaxID=1399860 RepID=A0A2C5ZIS6_9HYPO|nr:hypothetical protein CDD82_2181 [Ophiocordyceps australis]
MAEHQVASYKPRYIEIGINLADPIFRGKYHGTQKHPDDLKAVVGRALQVGCSKLIVTGSDLETARDALKLAQEYPGTIFATAGIHPCSSSIFGSGATTNGDAHTPLCDSNPSAPVSEFQKPNSTRSTAIISELTALITEESKSHCNRLVAFGEFGLDYDRLHYCNKTLQLHSFELQLRLAASLDSQLPLFLHSRAAHSDFVSLLKTVYGDQLERLDKGGVVHSFTGSAEEMAELMDLGLYIGINGCSFKTAQNCAVVKGVRLDKIMLETDGPWCEVRPSHAGYKYLVQTKPTHKPGDKGKQLHTDHQPDPEIQGNKKQKKEAEVPEQFKVVKKEKWVQGAMVKGRNEPCNIERVAQIVAGIKGISLEEVCEAAWHNSVKVFGLGQAI